MRQAFLRAIPAVEKLLEAIGKTDVPRPTAVSVIRREIKALRSENQILEFDAVVARIRAAINLLRRGRIQPVINATGVVVHTNLGRSPLGIRVAETLSTIAGNYNNLEYDLATGERGRRGSYIEYNLSLLCRAEAATVVNNCAAALVLIIRHFTSRKRDVIISRGELVQIGGGFRIPDMLEVSGAKLREVGTTNKTYLGDYAKSITDETGMILKVHRSNFFMGGFVDSPTTKEIAALAHKKGIPFIEDIGSGAIFRTEKIPGVEHEPTPAEVLRQGADLICFSGDKLFGGPQTGIIAGKRRFVSALKRDPFFRALRCDKLILSALQTTVDIYLEASARQESEVLLSAIPALRMLHSSNDELRSRGEKIVAVLTKLPLKLSLNEGESQVGGGTLPRSVISSITIDLVPEKLSLQEFAARLRTATIPIIGHIASGRLKLDLRTIFPSQDEELIRAIRACFEATDVPRMKSDS
jgi:L-seryl-tRNA(Ser) seleniumtransferase